MARILVIDDDAHVRELLRTTLELEGHEVVLAGDGKQGVSEFRAKPPDLVITDLIMPEQEGIETIRLLRTLEPRVPILAVSGEPPRIPGGFLVAARQLGADLTLAKPFGTRELRAAVESLLGS